MIGTRLSCRPKRHPHEPQLPGRLAGRIGTASVEVPRACMILTFPRQPRHSTAPAADLTVRP